MPEWPAGLLAAWAWGRRRPRPVSCNLEERGEGLDFPGFHRLERSPGLTGKPRVLFLAMRGCGSRAPAGEAE